jgi:hypothetical protein
MKPRLSFVTHAAVVLGLALGAAACGKPFDVKTSPGMVALENQRDFDWRATTPEGVVVGIRVVEDEKRGDLAFWTQAVTLQLRDVTGYALLESAETTSADGTKGRLLKFGHDEDGKPYVYWVAIFPAQSRLFLVETGGPKDLFDRARPNVEWTMKTIRVRCNALLAPVLASHTCNRW